ncbi:hypothetical protein NHQ30_001281 [Ciborinia camelliae]|nr:hypothetical protein NHQ30_001281 [Ciborinia camelliae]
MKLTTILPILVATFATALPTEVLTERDETYCVPQGPGTCTFGWQEWEEQSGAESSMATIYDHNCIQRGTLMNKKAYDKFMTVISANPPMIVSINGWAISPEFDIWSIPKFNYNGKTWGGHKGCVCGRGAGTNFWGCSRSEIILLLLSYVRENISTQKPQGVIFLPPWNAISIWMDMELRSGGCGGVTSVNPSWHESPTGLLAAMDKLDKLDKRVNGTAPTHIIATSKLYEPK